MRADGPRPTSGPLGALLLAAALLLAGAWMARTFDGPWQHGWLGHNGARYAAIGRNYARHGLLHLRGAPLLDGADHDPARPDVYGHHPPGVGMTLGLVFGVTGPDEDAARAVPSAATLLALALLAALVAGAFRDEGLGHGWAWGGLAALIAASMPMVSVYGAHVDVQGPPVLAASLATLLAYRRWRAGGAVAPLLAASALASAFDWYGLYAPSLCAAHLWSTAPGRRRAALALGAWTLLLFAAWLAWLVTLPGMGWTRLAAGVSVRTAARLGEDPARLVAGLAVWWRDVLELLPLLWLTLPAACAAAWLGASRGPDRGATTTAPATAGGALRGGLGTRGLATALLVPPIVHGLAFPSGLLQHGYWLFGLPYGLAVGLVLLSRRGVGAPARRPRVAAVAAGVAVLLALGSLDARSVLAPGRAGSLPALLGQALAARTAAADAILTNYDTNPLDPAFFAGYVLKRPALPYYADRTVRGGIDTPEALAEARRLVPRARWFLLTPPADRWLEAPPPPELAAALAGQAAGPPVALGGDPPVLLYPLGP